MGIYMCELTIAYAAFPWQNLIEQLGGKLAPENAAEFQVPRRFMLISPIGMTHACSTCLKIKQYNNYVCHSKSLKQ